jgi:hypothetical protein
MYLQKIYQVTLNYLFLATVLLIATEQYLTFGESGHKILEMLKLRQDTYPHSCFSVSETVLQDALGDSISTSCDESELGLL